MGEEYFSWRRLQAGRKRGRRGIEGGVRKGQRGVGGRRKKGQEREWVLRVSEKGRDGVEYVGTYEVEGEGGNK